MTPPPDFTLVEILAFSEVDTLCVTLIFQALLHHTSQAVQGASDLRFDYRALAVLRVDFPRCKRAINLTCRFSPARATGREDVTK